MLKLFSFWVVQDKLVGLVQRDNVAPVDNKSQSMELNSERYLSLMDKLISESRYVQNNPPKFVPEEDKIIKHLLDILSPHSIENGGVLKIQHVSFIPV